MPWNENLTGQALSIAACNESPLRVMAGPGTGKSFSMKKRIHRLLEEGVNPSKILTITFTRTAAADMINELLNLGVPGCENIRASTLHAFCYSVLIKNDVLTFLNRYPRPLITFNDKGILKFEVAPLLDDIALTGDFGNKREMCHRIRAFEAAWARLQSDVPGWPNNPIDNLFHRELISWLTFHKAMLIGEIIPETLKYFRNNPIADELSGFEHVIVDEFQDLNKAEQVLIDLLSQNSKCFIIGDEDQSIYSFRFAHPEGITTYNQTHLNTHDEPLTECRRCPQNVVKIADNLIKHNHPTSIETRLHPLRSNADGIINIVQWNNLEEESNGIANYIHYLVSSQTCSVGDILVLCPRRLIGYKIVNAIRSLGLEAHSYYYDAVLEDINGQKAFTKLSLLVDSEDRMSLRFWLGLEGSKWRASQYLKIRQYAVNNLLSPKAVMDGLISNSINISNVNQIKTAYRQLLSELAALHSLNLLEVFNTLFPENSDWALPLRKAIIEKITEEIELKELHQMIRNFISQPETPDEGDFVKVMSIHKSKGLNSKVVIIPSVIQGLIPRIDTSQEIAQQELSLKEQRRLFYVAITRTTDILLISSMKEISIHLAHKIRAKARRRSGRYNQINMASQFISELGPNAPASKIGSEWERNNYT